MVINYSITMDAPVYIVRVVQNVIIIAQVNFYFYTTHRKDFSTIFAN